MKTTDKSRADALTERVSQLEKALVYVGHHLHATPQYMLCDGVTLIDNDGITVKAAGIDVAVSLSAASPVERHEAAPADMKAALQWTAGTLQEIVSGRWKGANENDKVSIGSVTKTISQVLDMADAALGHASQPEPEAADERAAKPIGYIRADDLKELAAGNGAIISPRSGDTDVPVFARASSPNAAGAEGETERTTFDETACRAACDVCPGSAETGGDWPCARKPAATRAPSSSQAGAVGKRGTDAQILFERKLTCEAINGAMAFGYQNTNPPPSDDHWLAPYWKIGRQQADALDALHAIESDLLLGPHPSTALAAQRARKMIDAISPSAEG